jgi:uncharacterized protein YbjT (DUF2867 family)
MKIILTGATGMVGEGVLLECLRHPLVSEVLSVSRRPLRLTHPKLRELLVPDFGQLAAHVERLTGYDTCFYCAGISSVGLSETAYTRVTLTLTLDFARVVARCNPALVFNFVSGVYTDSSEKGPLMWARVKGKAENALLRLPFKGAYNFRPGFILPTRAQQNVKLLFKVLQLFYPYLFPKATLTFAQLAQAMIQTVTVGSSQHTLEIAAIKSLASTCTA